MKLVKVPFCIVLVLLFTIPAVAEETHCGFSTQRLQCGSLSCDKERHICTACKVDSDCYPSGMYCEASSGKCKLRSFFSAFSFGTFVAIVGAFFVCSVGVVAGVGGGGLLVPMFATFMSVPMKTAVGLSQATICGQSVLNVWLLASQKYPQSEWDRPIINYQYLSLLLPLGLIGTLIGSLLSKICPDLLRSLLLFALLCAVLQKTIKKLKAQYAADQAVIVEGTQEAQPSQTEDSQPPQPLKPSQEQFPMNEIRDCCASFVILLFFQIVLRLIECGGFLYWICVLCPLIALSGMYYLSLQRFRGYADSTPELLTFQWSERNAVYYPLFAVGAGAGAAMLGIGGGLVLGFVLYEVLIPEEASATSGTATCFIAYSAAIPQIISGTLPMDYGIILFFVGLASTALGQFTIMDYIKRNGLRYLIVASLAFVVGGSLVALGGYGIFNSVAIVQSGGSITALGKLCPRI